MGATLAVALAVIAVAVWSLVRGGDTAGDDGAGPTFSFDVRSVTGVGVSGKVEEMQLRRPAGGIRSTLDALYTAGFVDPAKWEGGRFPQALATFAGPAAARARRDIDDLTLGSTAGLVLSVRPEPGHVAIRFLLDDDRPLAAVARTSFAATATLREGGMLGIVHRGRYLLRRDGDRWAIVGYDVSGRLRSEGPARG